MEYPKIDTLFVRDEKFNLTAVLRHPVYDSFRAWHCTEKIDGTNIRVILSLDGSMEIRGRTDNAQIPADLVKHLMATFPAEKLQQALWMPDKETGILSPQKFTLYGEGYGAGIQKGGGLYRNDKSFRLFDVLVNDNWWLAWPNVEDIAAKLEIKTAPVMGIFPLEVMVDWVRNGFDSIVASQDSGQTRPAEGIIGRTIEPLFDRAGKRIILKLKTEDFTRKK